MSQGAIPSGLERRLGLRTATTTNILAMVGAGPFITIPLLLASMHGPQAMLGWAVGAAIAICDGLAWAELGAAIPRSGGAYEYLLETYGPQGPGRLLSFLFLWQGIIIGPLILASGAVGFAKYSMYLAPALTSWQLVALAVGVTVVCTLLVYRRIESVGRWSTVFGAFVLAAGAWIVVDALLHGRARNLAWPRDAFASPRGFAVGLGGATLYAMYDFMGYQTVCFVGGEVRRPERTIPRSVVLAVVAVASLYLAMNIGILSVMPWQTAIESKYVVSDFIAMLHGRTAGVVMTALILIITLAGVFAGMLGASRIPYAAAARGDFFRGFARLDASGHFPTFAVLYTGFATALCCLFPLDALIQAGTVIYILIQSVPVVVAVPLLRSRRRDIARPFQMRLYPIPVAVALAGWLYILSTSGAMYFMIAMAVLVIGVSAYLVRARRTADWPWPNRSATVRG